MAHTLAEVETAVGTLAGKVDKVLVDLQTALSQVGQLTADQQTSIDHIFDTVTGANAKLDAGPVAPAPVAPVDVVPPV